MTRERWMALCFALGSICFLIAPIALYAKLVGAGADSATYFAGSIPFTLGGAIQSAMALVDRRSAGAGDALWRSAAIQSIGTLFFNATTFRALSLTPLSAHYDRLVWRPNALGSVCFLISGLIAYRASPRRGWRPVRGAAGWWEPGLNLLGCVLFAISAGAGFSEPRTGSLCFLVCALATLVGGRTFKSPRLRRWEHDLERDLGLA
jgi:hypothetical protein